jgi:hypothetical protein
MDFTKKLNKALQNVDEISFSKINGGTILLVIIIILIVLFRLIYTQVKVNSQEIRKDWEHKRCYPHLIPFAGIIAPQKNKSTLGVTSENFAYCLDGILGKIIGVFLQPIYSATSSIQMLIDVFVNSVDSIRKKIASIIESLMNVFNEVFTIVGALMVPLQELLVRIKDATNKALAVTITSLYTIIGSYFTTLKTMRNFMKITLYGAIIPAIAAIVSFFLFPFTIPAGFAALAVLSPIMVIFSMITVSLSRILEEPVLKLPKLPSCFGGSTLLELKDGSKKEINLIQVGDILVDDGRVNSVIQLDINNQQMYYFPDYNLYVSETHELLYNNKWITVDKLYDLFNDERSLDINNKIVLLKCDGIQHKKYTSPYIYCLNTESGYIRIKPDEFNNSRITNHLLFSDWNDIEPYEYNTLSELSIYKVTRQSQIHKFFEGGFMPYTKIKLHNGNTTLISNICVGDILSCGSKVIGIVENYSDDIELYKHNIFGTKIIGATNNILTKINDISIDEIVTQDNINENFIIKKDNSNHYLSLHGFRKHKLEEQQYPRTIYHLITDTNTFKIDNITFCDYNSCVENYLK